MLELPHTIIGALIATKINQPFLALPLAFLSNFILDILPHWNPHLNTELKQFGKVSKRTTIICFIDATASLLLGLYLAFRFWPDLDRVVIIILGCFFAVIADLIEAPYFFLGWRYSWLEKLIAFQKRIQFNVAIVPGLISQVILLAIAFGLLFS